MRVKIVFVLALAAALRIPAGAISLRAAFEQAGPGQGYDKYVELETGEIYTGGLLIGPVYSPISWRLEGAPGVDVCIVGNGAILDLQGSQLCVSYCNNRLDVSDCIVVNGNIRFRGMNLSGYAVQPRGSVRHVTFYRPHDYGVRLQGAGDGITIERNLVVDAIDTGDDFVYTHGASNQCLPTGANISFSGESETYGVPNVSENWSYHSDPLANRDMLRHFSLLCEFG